ncbi:MAG: response regulator transcription factor [Pseudomonadota bacterium]
MNENGTILIVDDDESLGSMLADFLSAEGWNIALATDGHSGLEQATQDAPDAVVLDVMLPGMGGFDVLRALRQKSMVPVIMLTARGDETDRIVGLELGADDYLPKPFNPRELAARLRAILRRVAPDDAAVLNQDGLNMDRQSRRVTLDEQVISLTGAEFSILERLLLAQGEVVSKDELCRHALGRELLPYDRSVDTHISRLRGKLGDARSGEPRIQSIRGRGYILIDTS